jgi:hypothetical protein
MPLCPQYKLEKNIVSSRSCSEREATQKTGHIVLEKQERREPYMGPMHNLYVLEPTSVFLVDIYDGV